MNERQSSCFLLTLLSMMASLKAEFYLFRASQGGSGVRKAGLWGGTINISSQGQETNLFSHGYESYNSSNQLINGMKINMLSHDPIAHSVLLSVQNPHHSSPTIATAPLCLADTGETSVIIDNFKIYDDNHPFLSDTDCSWKCGIGPFAMYNNKIYFILTAVYGNVYALLKREIHLRVIEGCDDLFNSYKDPHSSRDFPVLQCSKLLYTIHTQKYNKASPNLSIWVAQDLKVISLDSRLHFLFQLFDTSNGASVMHLKQINIEPILETYSIRTLHTEPVDALFTGNLQLKAIGSVDYFDNFLCWTVSQKILCSYYDEDYFVSSGVVLNTGEAQSVCTGNMPHPTLKNAITGLAIAETRESLSIYFGCYADDSSTGGVGMVQVQNHGLKTRIYTVKSGSHKVYGGALFLTDTIDIGCPYYVSTTPKTPTQSYQSTETSTASIGVSSSMFTTISTTIKNIVSSTSTFYSSTPDDTNIPVTLTKRDPCYATLNPDGVIGGSESVTSTLCILVFIFLCRIIV